MMRTEDHIGLTDLELLTMDGQSLPKDQEDRVKEIRKHLRACEECTALAQLHVELKGSKAGDTGPAASICPPAEIWFMLVGGFLPEKVAARLLEHTKICEVCDLALKTGKEDIASDELDAGISRLKSSGAEWQQKLASRIASENCVIASIDSPTAKELAMPPVQPREMQDCRPPVGLNARLRGVLPWQYQLSATAALAALCVAAWFGLRGLRQPSADQLLAQAYSAHRTLEVRIAGAQYAPMRVERGLGSSNINKPSSLLKAEALIGENLSKSPNNPAWLGAKARADLIDGNYESAIQSLQRALQMQPVSAALLTDLGSAYFLRASSTGHAMDFGNAIEEQSKALEQSPDDPVALFNRALTSERIFLYTQAADDWEHYLRVDPTGEWANDARKHLAVVRHQLEQREKTLAEPLVKPEAISVAGENDRDMVDKLDGRIEEYLKLAITDWLPEAFSDAKPHRSAEVRAALDAVAGITEQRHDDGWLADLLRHPPGTQFRSAINALAKSTVANEQGDYTEGRNSARIAVQLFKLAGSPAGELRAQAEEIYSAHLLYEGELCISLLHSLRPSLEHNNYSWIKAQVSLEESNCANLVGDLGTYQSAIGTGMSEAQTHNYAALYLRGLGFQSQAAASIGDTNTGFQLACEGLSFFWSGHVDVMKGYNLYTDLDSAADELRLPNLQVALWKEATSLIDRHTDVLQRAMAHRWFGNAAYTANMPTLAEAEFAKASALFAAAPQTAATTRDHMDAEIWLAQLETRLGDLDHAGFRLQAIRPILESAPSFVPEIRFFDTLAELGIRHSDSAAAESALQPAVFLAEWALKSFPSESDRRQWANQTRSTYRNLVEWKLRQGDPRSALELWEWYRGAEMRADEHGTPHQSGTLNSTMPPDLRYAPSLPTPTVVSERLAFLHSATVVTYATFPDGIAVWVYDDRGIYSRWISTPLSTARGLAVQFELLCSDPTSNLISLRSNARSLYDLLILPIEDQLEPGRTIVLEPDDFLALIPWEALVDSHARYFIERQAITVSPGLYRTMLLRRVLSITPETPALVISVSSVPEEGLPPLTDVENEARTVVASFRSGHWLQGRVANLSAIRADIQGAVIFHFAGHAIASPSRTGLVLAEIEPDTQRARLINDESFRPEEISRLQLAVLSACNTGVSSQIGYSGTKGLTQSFLNAGVPHVISSRWNVDSSETANFMKQFYARLLAGNDVAESIRIAQLSLAAEPSSAHPFYWAAFELHGAK
jgi:CHAT domain-containing protein/tetratricopeptide (TPR) repeat protein